MEAVLSDPAQWTDHGRSQLTSPHPNVIHKMVKPALWLDRQRKPPWLKSHVAPYDGRMTRPPEATSALGQGEGAPISNEEHLDAGICKKFCDDGRVTDAVNILKLLVQRGHHVPNNLFYRVLRRCIASKDLDLGRRVHVLSVESGYEGDAFLATHLIGLYASHGRLEEAMNVFSKVFTPSVYNWATIIFAFAKHGEAVKALSLYRDMLKSTIQPDNRIYSAVLKACATAGDIVTGKEVHAHIVSSGMPDIMVQNGLIDMYAKCGSVDDAREVFDKVADKNVVTWTTMIAGYAQQQMGEEALSVYSSMQQEGLSIPDSVTFACLLQACACVGVDALHWGKQLHAQIEEHGLKDNVVLGGSLVTMYAKCSDAIEARSMFDRISNRNLVTWNAMLGAYAQQGMWREAHDLYGVMQLEGLFRPDSVTFVCLLQACASCGVGALHAGKLVHAQIEEQGLQRDVVVGCSLINMYAKCHSVEDARNVFNRLPNRNVVTWTAMIAGYAQQGLGQEALSLYSGMRQEGLSPPNTVTFLCLLQACASVGGEALHQGKQLHAQIEERGLQHDVALGGGLVNMYAKCGSVVDACRVFHTLAEKNITTWNTMLSLHVQQGAGQKALSLYSSMQKEGTSPDCVTFVSLLQACASLGGQALHEGKLIHSQIKEKGLQDDVVLGCSLVNMYAKCESPDTARRVFDGLSEKNVVTWSAMIASYSQQGMAQEALSLFNSMLEEGISPPDVVTYTCLLQACATVGIESLHEGKKLHAQIEELGLEEDQVLCGSLINMYAKCGSLEDARSIFDKLQDKSVVIWNAMLAGYAQQGMGQEALNLYGCMEQDGLCAPDSATFACVLQACANVGAVQLGKQLHTRIEEQGLDTDSVVGGTLVHMYAKCGSMPESQQVFDSLPVRTNEAWGALVAGYTRQGNSDVVFALLDRMGLEGMQPDGIMFLSLLTVCSHAGLVEKGRKYFEAMMADYGISPSLEHYTCMMDLLGRAGHLDEALQMAKTMPFPPDAATWHTLLGSCQKWENVHIGKQVFESAVTLDGRDAASYVLMSNIYARAQMWEEATEMQELRKKCGAWKEAGQCRWTDMDGVVHSFVAGK